MEGFTLPFTPQSLAQLRSPSPRHDNLKRFLHILKARPPGRQAQASSSCLALQLHLNLTASEQVVFAASLAMPGDRIILIKIYNGTSERTNLKENDMIMYNYVMVDDLWFAVKKLTWITSHVPLSNEKLSWLRHEASITMEFTMTNVPATKSTYSLPLSTMFFSPSSAPTANIH